MKSIKLFVVVLMLNVTVIWGRFLKLHRRDPDPDEFLNTTMLIRSKGYAAEEHNVTTQDGYILNIQRIPNPNKPVVFLQHGLLDASSSFAINFPLQSLGFVLCDVGYDVWMGNMRGNTYGLHHTKLTPDEDEFWDFSWTEMAEKDLPSMIDYVLEQTGQKDLIYIGHSQGTLIAFSQLGINPRLASQIKLFIAMGPVATAAHIKSPIKLLADYGKNSTQFIWYDIVGKKAFLPSSEIIKWMADTFCNIETMDKLICENLLFVYCGPSKHMNETRVPVYATHSPAGSSVKDMIHFSQMVISGKFQQFDYGSPQSNMDHYNQTEPPVYDLGLIKTPIALYSASNDWLADPQDVQLLRKMLPNIVDDYEIETWNHLDFIWAVDTKELLYDRMIKLMMNY